MTDLSTEYLGLKLSSPLVPSSSPLTANLDSARRLEDAGAAALVLPSLFEETINDGKHQAMDAYLERIRQYKRALGIPVIASLNGISRSGWIDFGQQLQQAGADAIELNVYYIAADPHTRGEDVEGRYVELLSDLREQVSIPIAMKLTSQFSSVSNMVLKLQEAGASGVSLFNRFYLPDIDLDTMEISPHLELSSPMESLLRIHWIALLREQVDISIAATGGLHDAEAIIKALMVGADVTHLCSVLLKYGHSHITDLKQLITRWLEDLEYESVAEIKGSASQDYAIDPVGLEHRFYQEVIRSYEA